MAYRRHFGAGKEFHRIRLTDDARAFLMTRGRTASRVEWWGAGIHDIGGAVYQSSEDAQKIWRQIDHFARQHHAARLAQIPQECELIKHAAAAGWQVEDCEVCPELALPSTWDEYLKMLGKNMREQMRRYPRRLEKQFSVEYELAQDLPSMEKTLDDLFRLHGKRWRARGQTGVLATPRRQRFHRDVCRAFLKRDWLRLWTLRCDGEAVCV
jgi:CelD/BcsL family acetyltransferase involved in cellulose biosynthesis